LRASTKSRKLREKFSPPKAGRRENLTLKAEILIDVKKGESHHAGQKSNLTVFDCMESATPRGYSLQF
jgi:hypothetical protein